MFNFIGNLKRTNGTFRQFWLAGGAFVFGIGMWAKHFVMLLATDQPLFFPWSMPISLLFVIFFSFLAFVMLTLEGLLLYRLVGGSIILAFGVAFMNYFILFGQPIKDLDVKLGYVGLSLLLLFAGTYVSFRLAEQGKSARYWLASTVLGLSVLVVQVLSLPALRIQYSRTVTKDTDHNIQLLAVVIGVGTILILFSTLVTWFIDKKLGQMDERYRLLVENSLDTIAMFKGEKWAT